MLDPLLFSSAAQGWALRLAGKGAPCLHGVLGLPAATAAARDLGGQGQGPTECGEGGRPGARQGLQGQRAPGWLVSGAVVRSAQLAGGPRHLRGSKRIFSGIWETVQAFEIWILKAYV